MANNMHHILYGAENLPLKIGSILVPCYILENGIQVFTKGGIHKALGYDGKSEDWLLDLLSSVNKFYPVSGAIFDAMENPMLFEAKSRDGSTKKTKGIPANLFLEVCQTIADAKNNGYLNVNQLKFAKSAEAILKNIGKKNLTNLIREATGFEFLKERAKNQLQDFLLKNSNDEAFQWVRTFPDSFFETLLGIHNIHWQDLKDQPQEFASIVHEIVFSRLSDDLLQQLRTTQPKRAYKSKTGSIQDMQHPDLKIYTDGILSLLKAAANNWTIFTQLLNRSYPKNGELIKPSAFVKTTEETPESLSELDKTILKGVILNKIYKKSK